MPRDFRQPGSEPAPPPRPARTRSVSEGPAAAAVRGELIDTLQPGELLRLQRVVGNQALARLIQVQRANGEDEAKVGTAGSSGTGPGEAPVASAPAQPIVHLSVKVTRPMTPHEFLVEFAVQYPGNDIDTPAEAEAGIKGGTVYWVDDHGQKIPTAAGPAVTAKDAAKGYKLVTVYAVGVTPTADEMIEELREEFYDLGGNSQDNVNQQTNKVFWDQTGYKVGKKLDPKRSKDDALMAKDWLRFRASVVNARQQYVGHGESLNRQLYELIPPEARALMFSKDGTGKLEPKDFMTALRIANKIANFTDAEREEYLNRVVGKTNDWDAFERAIDAFAEERGERGVAADRREDAKTELFGTDELYKAYHNYTSLRDAANASPDENLALEKLVDEAYDVLKVEMAKHGFKDLKEVQAWFDPRVKGFQAAFEAEALFVGREMLDRYSHVLYVERERILKPENLDVFFGQITAAGDDLEPLAESYPLLRDEDLRDDLVDVLTKWPAQDRKRRVLHVVLASVEERKKHIAKTRQSLKDDPELVYGFDVLREHAMAAQGVAEGSVYHQIIINKKEEIERDQLISSIMLAVIAIGAGLLTGGGGAVAVLGAATAATIGAYEALEEYRRYEKEHAAFKSGLLSDDPSFAWVIVAAVGAGLDMAAVGKAVRTLGPAIKSFDETGDVAELTTRYAKAVDDSRRVDAELAKTLDEAKESILKAAVARAQEQQAWRNVLIPATRLNDVLSATGESFARLVYAVYATLRFHGRNLALFLKTQQAQRLLGELATKPMEHAEDLQKLREAFKEALNTQQTVVAHAHSLGLKDFEIENWFKVWSENPGTPVSDILSEMAQYAAPLAARPMSKYRYATGMMTDQTTREVLGEYDLRIAGRGGIEKIHARKAATGERTVTIEGQVLEGMDRKVEAPNFNKTSTTSGSLLTAKEMGLPKGQWEWAHLWGPGFGDEAAAGLMMAPRSVNQFAQNRGVEGYIRELAAMTRARGGTVRVKATAVSWGNPTPSGWVPPGGTDFLQRAEYHITLDVAGEKRTIEVVISVAEPPSPKSTKHVWPEGAEDLSTLFP